MEGKNGDTVEYEGTGVGSRSKYSSYRSESIWTGQDKQRRTGENVTGEDKEG